MSLDVREEVRDCLFKAAINWKLPRGGETQKQFLWAAAIISELVSTASRKKFLYMRHSWKLHMRECKAESLSYVYPALQSHGAIHIHIVHNIVQKYCTQYCAKYCKTVSNPELQLKCKFKQWMLCWLTNTMNDTWSLMQRHDAAQTTKALAKVQ